MRVAGLLLVLLAFLLPAAPAAAHKPSDSYLRVLVGPAAREPVADSSPSADAAVSLRWDVALKDLDFLIGLDADGDSAITWGELKAKRRAVAGATLSRLDVDADGVPLALSLDDLLVTEHSDGAYATLLVGTDAATEPAAIAVRYRLLFEADPTHRGLVFLDAGGSPSPPVILSPEAPEAALTVDGRDAGAARELGRFVTEGVHHIWRGLDHLLFLITLLLPAVLIRKDRRWEPAPDLRAAASKILSIVTAFTIAHSLTLWVATAGWFDPPSRWVEASIAASIIFCALHNLVPRIPITGVAIAFGFGLLHGFGFAGVLRDLGLGGSGLTLALLGFNVGVELGQLAIVAAFVPIAWLLRGTAFYRVVVLRGGSVAVAVLAGIWLTERAFGLKILGI